MKIEKASIIDAKDLSELTIRSKSHWGYSKAQIEKWRVALTVSEDYIIETEVYKLTNSHDLIGYYSFFRINDFDGKMDNLFVEPRFIGKGYGKILMDDFLKRALNSKYNRIILEADPYAEAFCENWF